MSFDPYHEWFGIPASKRPDGGAPDYYVLLGLRRFETDPTRIHEAALNRMKLLRQRQTGTRGELTQQLMNEVSQARLCLADPARKSQYDFELEQRFPRHQPEDEPTRRGAPVWLVLAAGLLVVGGGAATYLAVMKSAGRPAGVAEAPNDEEPAPEAKEPPPPIAAQTKVADKPPTGDAKRPAKDPSSPAKESTPPKAIEKSPVRPALVKLRELPNGDEKPKSTAEGAVVHLTSVATDADEEDPTFVDSDGRWLGFQRKAGGKSQFIAAERGRLEEPFTTEHLVQGLPDGVRLQGIAVEPGELSCIFATSDGKGLLQAKRSDKASAWGDAAPLVAADGPVKGSWPSLTADGKTLYCIQQRSGKARVLALKRATQQAAFEAPTELPLGNAFSQAAVSPDGELIVLRGPEEIYVSRREKAGAWSSPEVVLAIRAFAGANRALNISPCFSPDGKWLLFASNRDGGAGGFDLWSAPVAMLTVEPPDLSKMADKGPAKKKPAAGKKETASDKSKAKIAKGSEKPTKKTSVPVASSGTPVTEAITEWLVLGPYPDVARESVKAAADFKQFEGVELLRRMPKENLKSREGLVWNRAAKFGAPGVYSVAVWLRLKSSADLRVIVDSAPGGGVLWFNSEHSEVSWRVSEPWSPLEGSRKGEPVSLLAGRYRLVGVVCVADPSKPLAVRVVNAEDDSIPEGLSVGF